MNMTTFQNELSTMKFGRAMHMDLARASDEKLAAAYKVLDDYDTNGLASAYTQDKIDARLSAIDDETDRRAGVEPAPWNPQPSLHVVGVAVTIVERDAVTGKPMIHLAPRGAGPDADADTFSDSDLDAGDDADGIPEIVAQLDPVSTTDGLVPGETSAI